MTDLKPGYYKCFGKCPERDDGECYPCNQCGAPVGMHSSVCEFCYECTERNGIHQRVTRYCNMVKRYKIHTSGRKRIHVWRRFIGRRTPKQKVV